MRRPHGRHGRRLAPAVSGALCVLAGVAACSSDAAPRGDAPARTGQASAALALATAPESIAFELSLEGRVFQLSLERTRPPTTSDYRSFRRTHDGDWVALPAPDLGCTYRGVTEAVGAGADTAPGFAAMSVCSNITGQAAGRAASGVLRAGGQLWRLWPDPLDDDDSDGVDHFAQRLRRPDASGAVAPVSVARLRRLPESPAPRLAFREGTDQETKYIDLLVVNDAARVAQLGGDTEATTVQFVDTMNALLDTSGLSPRLRVTLRGQVLFEEDPYTPAEVDDEVDNDSLLNLFLSWGRTAEVPEHDEHMLLSGLDFVGGVVGYAGLGVACNPNANGFIVQAGSASGGFAVLSAVHELGHTLGMGHDSGQAQGCPTQGLIMAAVGCGNCPGAEQAEFSPCSVAEFQDFLAGPAYAGTRCADDVPSGALSRCGDGAVQQGETCDCGSSDCSDIDPCCDGATCQLQADAECSDFNDSCCQNCAIVSADAQVVCRPQRSACDSAELCSGADKACPADSFEAAGEACEDDRGNPGACYFGDCRSRGTQCDQIAQQQEGNPNFDDVGAPPPTCALSCNQVTCGNGTNACIGINGVSLVDGVPCDDGQCVDGDCVETIDQCPSDPSKDEPGDCGCGVADVDTDGDGAADCIDGCDEDADKLAPGACGCGAPDTDSDGDGTLDCDDDCPDDASKSEPGACGCGQPETDSDSDGTPDCIDQCPEDRSSSEPGACGCGVAEIDTDSDGTPDCMDGCITDPARTAPPCTLVNGTDTDGDGVVDVSLRASARSKGGCALVAPGAAEAPSGRMLDVLGWLALAVVPLWRRRRKE